MAYIINYTLVFLADDTLNMSVGPITEAQLFAEIAKQPAIEAEVPVAPVNQDSAEQQPTSEQGSKVCEISYFSIAIFFRFLVNFLDSQEKYSLPHFIAFLRSEFFRECIIREQC